VNQKTNTFYLPALKARQTSEVKFIVSTSQTLNKEGVDLEFELKPFSSSPVEEAAAVQHSFMVKQ